MADMIPGRRVSNGDQFYTDWFARGGDSMLLRAEAIYVSGANLDIDIVVETRKEPGTTITTPIAPTYVPAGSTFKLEALGMYTAYWRATDDGDSGGTPDSLQAQVRLKISTSNGSSGDYKVIRIFPPVFFDNSKP